MIDEHSLKPLINFDTRQQYLESFFKMLADEYKNGNHLSLLSFINNYTIWNAYFALGVVALTSQIGMRRNLFRDPTCPIPSVADRSIHVASFVYDASRDEFNDSMTPTHAPHRSLAQALLLRLIQIHYADGFDFNEICKEDEVLKDANDATLRGYCGGREAGAALCFYGMGYHAGSEILADMEFTALDRMFKEQLPELFDKLHGSTITLSGIELRPYHWIRAHSGHGAAVEQAHYAYAIKAINAGLQYVTADKGACIRAMELGFTNFAVDQMAFFDNVCKS